MRPVLETVRAQGRASLRGIAAELNVRGMLTRRGGLLQVSNVNGLIHRLGHRQERAPELRAI